MRRALAAAVLVAALAACTDDDDPADVARSDGTDATREAPAFGDHWHMAYGVYVCDRYIEPLVDQRGDANGIHTHNDGLIHVHPTTVEAQGDGAVLGLFAEEVGLGLEEGAVALPPGFGPQDEDRCREGEPSLRVLTWDGPEDASADVHEDDLGSIPLTQDGVVAVVFAPDDVEVPQPPSVPSLQAPVDLQPG